MNETDIEITHKSKFRAKQDLDYLIRPEMAKEMRENSLF